MPIIALKYFIQSSKSNKQISFFDDSMKNGVRINLELKLGSKEARFEFLKLQLPPSYITAKNFSNFSDPHFSTCFLK